MTPCCTDLAYELKILNMSGLNQLNYIMRILPLNGFNDWLKVKLGKPKKLEIFVFRQYKGLLCNSKSTMQYLKQQMLKGQLIKTTAPSECYIYIVTHCND